MDEKMRLRYFIWPFILVFIAFVQLLLQEIYSINFSFGAIHPRSVDGLAGILLSEFIHSGWSHFFANIVPFLLFSIALYYYYHFASRLLIYMVLLTNFYVWLMGRDGLHVGASGLVYAMSSFHILSALLRKELRLMAFALLVIFLYGSMIWGFFPEFFPNENISWESHLMGFIVGIVFAFYYRKDGPQKPQEWFDNEDGDEDSELVLEIDEQTVIEN